MAGFHSASDFVKVGFFLLLGTIVLHLISYGSPYWTTRHNGNAGLWAGCFDGLCYERFNLWVERWIKACQTFMTLALITLFTSTVCVFFFIFHKHFDQDRRLIFIGCVFSFATSLMVFLCVVVWASNEYLGSGEKLNWPFALACGSALSSFAAGLVFVFEIRTPIEK